MRTSIEEYLKNNYLIKTEAWTPTKEYIKKEYEEGRMSRVDYRDSLYAFNGLIPPGIFTTPREDRRLQHK